VWNKVQKYGINSDPSKMAKSKEFQNLITKYPTLEKLLKNQLHGMVVGALNYKHDYIILDKKIGYKDNDSISFKINYGFKTVFANMFEYSRGNISKVNLDESLTINLMIAEFAYAKLPIFFVNILGVTGTLEVLPQYKK
jgi:hypothetical protein